MPPLPKDRVTVSKPFENIGCDFMGSFLSKTQERMYVCLYKCLTTRALHLEFVESMTTGAFLNSFIRFISRRGVPRVIRTDCGTNFKHGKQIIETMYEREANTGNSLTSYSAVRKIKWIFTHLRHPGWVAFGKVNYCDGRQWLKPGDFGASTPKSEPHAKNVICASSFARPARSTENSCRRIQQSQRTSVTSTLTLSRRKFAGKWIKFPFSTITHVNVWLASRRVRRCKTELEDAPHPPYSLDMATTHSGGSQSEPLSHFLDGRQFEDDKDLKSGLQSFFNEKSPEFYQKGIYDLSMR
ncbi:hypothetical protein OESDEN_08354 [Oesophagostomum dentatum]|uniref:Integrase catalytic domain-containing protein n=1 Tax=Oesophagostomum dentatum TaxID=61180 RepID=A0A0B1T3F8_OESDE|nr:hypothetical protein OESDEN_08354 [Oesophagostomum dentatum]